jgi:gamma-glutamylcyclotransferase (GGCT)/AIG2-like uncharacterized protein YtfP
MMPAMPLLFAYGTLQDEAVQRETFGRTLCGDPDELPGFDLSWIEIEDPDFAAAGGRARHAIVRPGGREESRVKGTVFEVTDEELALADAYEPAPYRRVAATLASGRRAWVYSDASSGDF